METITIPKKEYLDLISMYLKIKQRIGVITQFKSEEELLSEFYDNKLQISELALINGEVVEHSELINEVEQWKKARN